MHICAYVFSKQIYQISMSCKIIKLLEPQYLKNLLFTFKFFNIRIITVAPTTEFITYKILLLNTRLFKSTKVLYLANIT